MTRRASAACDSAARLAMATIRGDSAAVSVLGRIAAGTAAPDAVEACLRGIAHDGQALSGFARRLQKALEAARDGRSA